MFDSIAMFESPWQWAIVLVIVLILFGGGRVKDLMGSLGSGMREFKKGLNEDDDDRKSSATRTESTKDAADKEAASKP